MDCVVRADAVNSAVDGFESLLDLAKQVQVPNGLALPTQELKTISDSGDRDISQLTGCDVDVHGCEIDPASVGGMTRDVHVRASRSAERKCSSAIARPYSARVHRLSK